MCSRVPHVYVFQVFGAWTAGNTAPDESWHAEQPQKQQVPNLGKEISIGLFSGARVGLIG